MIDSGTLSDDEIVERVDWLEHSGEATDEERAFYAKHLADYYRGPVAEDAVRRLIPLLADRVT